MTDELKEKVSNVLKFARPALSEQSGLKTMNVAGWQGCIVAGRDVTINVTVAMCAREDATRPCQGDGR